MRHLAQALVKTAAFLELADDEVLDPDAAIEALETISEQLQAASPAEKDALRAALAAELAALPDSAEAADARSFYADFMDAFGLDEA